MSIWTDFACRHSAIALTEHSEATEPHRRCPRGHAIHNLQQRAAVQLRNNPSFHELTIDGRACEMAVVSFAKKFNVKKLCALPGEHIAHGGLVFWKNNHWIVTQVDADDTAYESALMQQCNFRLRWRNSDGKIIEKWCIVEDGTKYLVGLDRTETMELGAARIAVTVAKDLDTKALRRGDRFLISDPDADEKLSFRITKPNTLFNIFEEQGIYRYIMTETVVENDDDTQNEIAGRAENDLEGGWL